MEGVKMAVLTATDLPPVLTSLEGLEGFESTPGFVWLNWFERLAGSGTGLLALARFRGWAACVAALLLPQRQGVVEFLLSGAFRMLLGGEKTLREEHSRGAF